MAAPVVAVASGTDMLARRWRRVDGPVRVALLDDSEQLFEFLGQCRATDLILDVEPWLVHWTEPADLLQARLDAWRGSGLPDCTIKLCTNSARFGSPAAPIRLISKAGKPRTQLDRLYPLGARPVVAGDLLLLDGLLARRLCADFAWLRWRSITPPWPRVLRFADRIAAPILLQSGSEATS